ncbi:MAG: hypothetical protein WBD40_12085 [Tepidisphaeraceae bacterium]
MGDQEKHVRQWKHNRLFIETIEPRFPDWIVTASFYVALHAVDSLLAFDKVHGVTSHDSRNRVLFETNRYLQIKRHYIPLYDLARTVRYLANPQVWVPYAQVETQVLRRHLYPLETSVQKLMGASLGFSEIHLSTGGPSGMPRSSDVDAGSEKKS